VALVLLGRLTWETAAVSAFVVYAATVGIGHAPGRALWARDAPRPALTSTSNRVLRRLPRRRGARSRGRAGRRRRRGSTGPRAGGQGGRAGSGSAGAVPARFAGRRTSGPVPLTRPLVRVVPHGGGEGLMSVEAATGATADPVRATAVSMPRWWRALALVTMVAMLALSPWSPCSQP
jgi:hypothetical protein